jgi:hypothetical protein
MTINIGRHIVYACLGACNDIHQFKRQSQPIGRLCHAGGLQFSMGVGLCILRLKDGVVNVPGVLLNISNMLRFKSAPVSMATGRAHQSPCSHDSRRLAFNNHVAFGLVNFDRSLINVQK